jgi:SAM-dependent methyltransferase
MKSGLNPLPQRPNYGIDAPRTVRGFFAMGCGGVAGGVSVPPFLIAGFKITLVGPTLLALGCISLGLCASMVLYSLYGKFRIRDIMLGMVKWRGDEAVLDLGTGRGLLAAGAAKRLPEGTVTGIDIWKGSDLSGNTLENAQHNIELEGLQGRVQLRSDDARDIGFVDNSFDVVVSLLCLHIVGDADARAAACREIARVLRPRGVAIIGDYGNIAEYARELEAAGLRVDPPQFYLLQACTALWILRAEKRR